MKKILLLTLSLALVFCSISSTSFTNAAETGLLIATNDTGKQADNQQAQLENAILKVKSIIDIPESLTEFDSDYYETYRYSFAKAMYRLIWYTKDGNQSIEVSTDENGNILEYYKFSYPQAEGAPKYLKAELEEKVDKFVYSLSDEFSGKLRKIDAVNSNKTRYSYKYERIENDIPMPSNSITVEVDNRNGEISNANINWLFNQDLAKPNVKLTKTQAKDIIKKNVDMELRYMDNIVYNEDGTYDVKTFLAYFPSKGYIAVDATTGKVYDTTSEWNEIVNTNDTKSEADAKDTASYDDERGGVTLSEAELAKIAELKDLITKEKAISIIKNNKSLLFDKSMISVNASLSTTNSGLSKNDRYVWSIRFSDPTPADYEKNDYYRAYANATVDAKTGEIISYRASSKSFYDMTPEEVESLKINYSDKKCRNILEKFISSQNKEMFENAEFNSKTKDNVIKILEDETRVYAGNGFSYVRVNEGIQYPSNYIFGSVDAVTGKISNYYYNWYESVKFDSPKKAVSKEKAMNNYLELDGFDLVNEIVTVNNYVDADKTKLDSIPDELFYVTYKTRTVYRTDIYPYYIDAFSGKQINAEGEVYDKGETKGYTYSDISGNKYERSIKLLADLGIGFDGNKFKPNQVIKKNEFNDMLSNLGFYLNSDNVNLNSNKKLTNKEAAKAMINCLRLDKVANLKGIYKTSFADNKKIGKNYIGYVALAEGMKLFEADKNNNFNPDKGLTRAQAAYALVELLGVKNIR